MRDRIDITPEEIFFLGKMCGAKYIDYAYIAAMSEVGADISAFEKETQSGLVKKGLLEEDFSGNVELSEDVKDLLKPVYFGEVETELTVSKKGDVNSVRCSKYHIEKDKISKVNTSLGNLEIRNISIDDIQKDVSDSLEQMLFSETTEIVNNLPLENVDCIISAKATMIGKKSVIKAFFVLDGKIYQETDAGFETVTEGTYKTDVAKILKGEI